MALYIVKVSLTMNGRVEVDAADEHEARTIVGQLETSLLDEVANWPTTELEELNLKACISDVRQH